MSSPVYLMTARLDGFLWRSRRAPTAAPGHRCFCCPDETVRLTVPLLCSPGRRRFQSERVDQVHGGRAQGQLVQRCPQVDDVPLLLAGGVEAVEDVVVQIDTEGSTPGNAKVSGTFSDRKRF